MIKLFTYAMCCVLASTQLLCAQAAHPYEQDVQTIKRFDKMYVPPANPILFVGSSSIRKWEDLERTFSSYVAMNRGIGGAVTEDIIYYAQDLIFDYHPRQIVIYVGENDVMTKGVTGDSIYNRFKRLYGLIRNKLPNVPVEFIALKPSPSRVQHMQTVERANLLISKYLAKEKNAHFINIFALMLDKNHQPRPELFVSDMLHMNAKGYAIWRAAVVPYLSKR